MIEVIYVVFDKRTTLGIRAVRQKFNSVSSAEKYLKTKKTDMMIRSYLLFLVLFYSSTFHLKERK